jgi:hypothetical protein
VAMRLWGYAVAVVGVMEFVVELPPAVREARSTAGGRALGVAGDPFDISVGGTDVRRITGHVAATQLSRVGGDPRKHTRPPARWSLYGVGTRELTVSARHQPQQEPCLGVGTTLDAPRRTTQTPRARSPRR